MRRRTTTLVVTAALTVPVALGVLPSAAADELEGTLAHCDDDPVEYCLTDADGAVHEVGFGPPWYLADTADAGDVDGDGDVDERLAQALDDLIAGGGTVNVETGDGGDVLTIDGATYRVEDEPAPWTPVARGEVPGGGDEREAEGVDGEESDDERDGPDDDASDVAKAVFEAKQRHADGERCADDAAEPADQPLEDSCRDFGLAVAEAARRANGSLSEGESFTPGREADDAADEGAERSRHERENAARAQAAAPRGGDDGDGGDGDRGDGDRGRRAGPADHADKGGGPGGGRPAGAGRP